MKGLKVFTSILVVLLALGMLWVGSLPEFARAGTPSSFVNVRQPIGLAGAISFKPPLSAAGVSVWLVTQLCQGRNENRNLLQVEQSGASPTVFAVLNLSGDTTRQGCFEDYVAQSPGLGSYGIIDNNAPDPGEVNTNDSARFNIYVTQGGKILEVPRAGCGALPPVCPRTFAVISSLQNTNVGITFDRFGQFGHDMIVVGTSTVGKGQVWRVRREITDAGCGVGLAPCGVAFLIFEFSAGALGISSDVLVGGPPAVVPATFAKCPAGVLVASQASGAVYCVRDADGLPATTPGAVLDGNAPTTPLTKDPVAAWSGAKGVHFVEPSPFSCGPAGVNRFFMTTIFKQNGNLTQFPTTDFTSPPQPAGLDGRAALVTSATGAGIGQLTAASPVFPTSLGVFQSPIGEHRGSDFCARNYGQIIVSPNSESQGKITVIVLSRPAVGTDPGFFPQAAQGGINAPTCKFGRIGNEPSFFNDPASNQDANFDGIPDKKMNFVLSIAFPNLQPGENVHNGILTCLLFPNSPDEGFAGGE